MDAAPKTPADRIVTRFGVSRLAAWTKRHRSRIHAWTWPTDKGGTGGVVPVRLRSAIIEGAHVEMGQTITFAEFEPQDGEIYMVAEPQA